MTRHIHGPGTYSRLGRALHHALASLILFFFKAEDVIRYLVRSRGLGDVYKRQAQGGIAAALDPEDSPQEHLDDTLIAGVGLCDADACLLYTSDAADERSSVDLGGRRIIKKTKQKKKTKKELYYSTQPICFHTPVRDAN